MIDGFKLIDKSFDIDKFEKSPAFLLCKDSYNVNTGEASNNRHSFYSGLRLSIKESSQSPTNYIAIINGSLANFYNKGKGNAFDFHKSEIEKATEEMLYFFGLNYDSSFFQKIEAGANIQSEISNNRIMQSIIAINSMPFSSKNTNKFKGKEIDRTNKCLKVYDKSTQKKECNNNLLRIEYVAKNSKHAKTVYPNTNISALFEQSFYSNYSNELCNEWLNITFVDPESINKKLLSSKELEKWLKYQNPYFWTSLTSKARYDAKKRLTEMKNKYASIQTQEIINNLLYDKLNHLMKN